MSCFSVDYNSLKRSSEALLNMGKSYYVFAERIKEICRDLPLADSARPKIISSLNSSRKNIVRFENKYKSFGMSLNKISDLYLKTTD